ncbi:hypothetical protein DYBT9623_04012 [Dyadobacter sp. CECT 9623]|uniref:Dialkylrecorsinol condensing enzyme DarA n=1 Tax=Dyadobacter linearis TaxID=2823330 RepID=A0ABM8UUK8_9BACT|nr:hypothetical protein [Dyadobacter sp. CECT 9623]CAG5072075.1 hypothetical protein DYBT9623_04012 [Dyadobacter sp. CECT 9623]
MAKVLVVNYSQSGQLHEIIDNFLAPFDPSQVERIIIKPVKPINFPWTSEVFYDTMPECVLEEPIRLEPINYGWDKYDIIVIGYQPWFLSPSLPITSLLQDPEFQRKLNGTPVVTIIGGRNMWLNSQESIKKYIREAGGTLVGNIPLMDREPNLISVLTIFHWMLTGRKERKWNLLPVPGVGQSDIDGAGRFGLIVNNALKTNDFGNLQKQILSLGLIEIPTDIWFIEMRGKKIFKIWAGLIKKKGTTPEKRKFFVNLFKYYLLIALFVASPIILTFYFVLIAPFMQSKIKKEKEYFYGVA